MDFNARDNAPSSFKGFKGVAPEGDLHNFSGGTWDWFTNHLQKYVTEHPEGKENIILLVHHPFTKFLHFGFSNEELDTIEVFLKNYEDKVYAEFAGHIHYWNRDYEFRGGIMRVAETQANKDRSLARIVQIYPDGRIDFSKFLPENGMNIKTTCSVDLVVIDPEGLIISKELNQIPGAIYIESDIDGDGILDDSILILERKEGEYKIKVIAEPEAVPTDTYSLEVALIEDSFGYTSITVAEDVPIGEIPTEPYTFESKERQVTQLTCTEALSVQYSASIRLSAVLTDKNGNALSDRTVIFEIGGESASATTDSNGVVTTSLTLNQAPGEYLVYATYVGDKDYLPSSDSRYFQFVFCPDFVDPAGVGVEDIMQIANRWRCKCGDPCYDPLYDVDDDCDIDTVDIMLVVAQWGETCW